VWNGRRGGTLTAEERRGGEVGGRRQDAGGGDRCGGTEAVADGGTRGMEVCGHGLLLPLNWACRFFERPDELFVAVFGL